MKEIKRESNCTHINNRRCKESPTKELQKDDH